MNRYRLERIELLLERLDTALVVRDPGGARSADAFDGLRKQIIQAGTNHRSHIAHLLSLSDSLERNAPPELIRDRVNDFLAELGIVRWTDCSATQAFEIVDGEGKGLECVEAAIVERLDNGHLNVIRMGKARRHELPVEENHVVVDELQPNPTESIPIRELQETQGRPSLGRLVPWMIPAGTAIVAFLLGWIIS